MPLFRDRAQSGFCEGPSGSLLDRLIPEAIRLSLDFIFGVPGSSRHETKPAPDWQHAGRRTWRLSVRITPSNHDILRTSHSQKGMRIHWLMIGCQFVSHCCQIGLLQGRPEVKLGYTQANHIRSALGWKARSTVNYQRNLNHLTYPA